MHVLFDKQYSALCVYVRMGMISVAPAGKLILLPKETVCLRTSILPLLEAGHIALATNTTCASLSQLYSIVLGGGTAFSTNRLYHIDSSARLLCLFKKRKRKKAPPPNLRN